jgi:hypothetical protein
MEPERLKEITEAANEAVKNLPQDLRQTAFQTILNKLLDEKTVIKRSKNKSKSREIKKPKQNAEKKSNPFDEQTAKLLAGINRTEYTVMFDLKLTLDKSLYTIKIAKDKFNIDGLIPSQISTILWENFRVKATKFAVGMALMEATKYVNRKPVSIQGGSGYIYHIAHEGEKYIENKLKEVSDVKNKAVKED